MILHSYHPGFTWTKNISSGLHSVLDEANIEIDIHIEYMDSKDYLTDVIFPQLEQLYKVKYENVCFDLIITTDDNALNFLLARRDQLFPGVPIVFCGLNNYTESRIEGVYGITGVAEALDLVGTIELALDLHPGTRYVAVVNDVTPTGLWNLERFKEIVPEFTSRIEFIELFNLSAEELTESLRVLPDETVLLLLSYYRDRAGKIFSYPEYTALVTENCSVPVYTAWDMFLGHGVLGGIVTSGEAQGEHAARLALRILKGEQADEIPVLTESPNVPMFDFNVMQSFGISISDLPPGRIIINEPVSLYYRYKTFFLIGLAFVLLQFFTILALTINVLRRRRAEYCLRQSEVRYRGIVEDQTELICRNLPDGTLTFVNDAYCRYFNKNRNELIGHKFMPLIPDEDHQAVKNYFTSLGSENPVATHEHRVIKPDGELRWNQWTNRAILDEEGKVIEFQGSGHDINKRKQIEKALRNSEEHYRSLVTNIPDIVWTTDCKGNITFISQNIITVYGYTPEEIYKNGYRLWFNRVHSNDIENVKKAFKTLFEKGERLDIEYQIKGKDGNWIWLHDRAIAVYEKDGVLTADGIFSDITERKHAEQSQLNLERQVLHVQKLESLGVLAGGIAHDFNNIMTAILGNISCAQTYTEEGSDLYKHLSEAEIACSRANALTRQLLTFSCGGVPIMETVRIGNLLKESIEFALHGSNVNCMLEIEEDLWPINADPGQVSQVLNNLIINADQAMPDGGKVNVRAENADLKKEEIPILQSGRYVKVEVRDRGVGILEKNLIKIFNPYFTTKQKGSGLGLAIVFSIIKNHQGTISVESGVGKGTTFTFYLPASEIDIKKEERKKDKMIPGHGRILLMDDEEHVLNVAGSMLERLGYEVEIATGGKEAVDKYKKAHEAGYPFNAVILDLTVKGGMGGEAALKKLKEIDPSVNAIVSSGYSTDSVMANYRKAGFSGVIAKPYKMKKMSQVLASVILKNEGHID